MIEDKNAIDPILERGSADEVYIDRRRQEKMLSIIFEDFCVYLLIKYPIIELVISIIHMRLN